MGHDDCHELNTYRNTLGRTARTYCYFYDDTSNQVLVYYRVPKPMLMLILTLELVERRPRHQEQGA